MADPDLIACLYPFYGKDGRGGSAAKSAIEDIKNHVPPKYSEPEIGRRDRAPTEEPEQRGGGPFDHLPRLELRFSNGPKTPYGFVFGCDENSDVVLPGMRGISSHHFALTLDEQYRPIVKDLGSLCGTEVIYDNEGGRRRDFRWIVGGHGVPEKKMTIVIEVVKDLKFQIVVSHHDVNSQLYMDNVDQFRQGTVDTENLFGRLDLPPETERPTGTHTPGTGAIFLRKKLGEGSFGVVTHFWNVSTGEEYALKQPSQRAIKDKDVDIGAWRSEADIMRRITHEHIVRLLDAKNDPWPKLYLEYVPSGSLHDQEYISAEECVQILRQLLSALVYLHGRDPPIVHRDIKLENVLVQYRHAGDIHVKFGDFGLSRERRESGNWKTICGTWKYAAPEILEMKKYLRSGGREKKRYTAAVDIWSLGVVVFKLLCGLPRHKQEYRDEGTFWGKKIIKKLREDLGKRPNEDAGLID
ncbi:kinase-like protein [Thozetella sp. PMI_491]|nr:kinase-like protein [Thozetella sp. PMI_491]